jgi:hypothetical protein
MLVSEDAPTGQPAPAIETPAGTAAASASPSANTEVAPAAAATSGSAAPSEAAPAAGVTAVPAAPTSQTSGGGGGESITPRATPEQVADIRGTIYSLPVGSAYDDLVVLHDRNDLHVGIMSFDAELDLELQALRDSGQTLRLWGLFYAQAEDYGGGRLVVDRFAIEPATFTPTAGPTLSATATDDDRETPAPALTATVTSLPVASRAPSLTPVATDTPAATATRFAPTATTVPSPTATSTRTAMPSPPATPTRTATPTITPVPTSQTVNGWTGTIHSAESGSPYNDYFELAGDSGERYGLTASYDPVSRRIRALRDSGQQARIWGVLNYGVDDYNGCQIIVVRIEQVGP